MDRLRGLLVAELQRNLLEGGRPRLPEGSDILWQAFTDLSKARSYHAAGPNPIAFSEIDAWCRLTRWPLRPHHVEIVRAMDSAFIDFYFENRKQAPADVKTLPPRSEQSVSAQLFDVIFG